MDDRRLYRGFKRLAMVAFVGPLILILVLLLIRHAGLMYASSRDLAMFALTPLSLFAMFRAMASGLRFAASQARWPIKKSILIEFALWTGGHVGVVVISMSLSGMTTDAIIGTALTSLILVPLSVACIYAILLTGEEGTAPAKLFGTRRFLSLDSLKQLTVLVGVVFALFAVIIGAGFGAWGFTHGITDLALRGLLTAILVPVVVLLICKAIIYVLEGFAEVS